MKKRFLCFVFLLAILFCFSGCEHYDQGDADKITEKGTEMMQAWLDENMPGAQLAECSAFIQNIAYSSHEYLTDYAAGRISLNGEESVFAIDTVTGDVYFENDRSKREELNEIAAAYLYETMGITPQGSDDSFECYVLAPFRDEGHELKAYQFNYGFDFGLPADVEDLETFVREPASRPLLYVGANITLLDDTDVSAYDLEAIESLGEQCGMLFDSISIESGVQRSSTGLRDWLTESVYTEYGRWIERDGFYLYGRVRVREEERNSLTGELTGFDRRFDPQQDLVFEEIETGYQYYLPTEDWQDEIFYIRAHEGAEILQYNYIEHFYSDVEGFITGKYDAEEKEGTETIWQKQSTGDYTLVVKKNENPISFSHAGRLERID